MLIEALIDAVADSLAEVKSRHYLMLGVARLQRSRLRPCTRH